MGFRGYRFFSPKRSKAKYKTLGTSWANFGGKKPRIILREVRYLVLNSVVLQQFQNFRNIEKKAKEQNKNKQILSNLQCWNYYLKPKRVGIANWQTKKYVVRMVNRADSDQTAPEEQSDQGLRCLLRYNCPITFGSLWFMLNLKLANYCISGFLLSFRR